MRDEGKGPGFVWGARDGRGAQQRCQVVSGCGNSLSRAKAKAGNELPDIIAVVAVVAVAVAVIVIVIVVVIVITITITISYIITITITIPSSSSPLW